MLCVFSTALGVDLQQQSLGQKGMHHQKEPKQELSSRIQVRPAHSIYKVSIGLAYLGIALLVAGIVIGWGFPWLSESIGFLQIFRMLISAPGSKVDVNAFLGANITALAVIIAVLIGYNASTLQIAGQLLSPALVRAILLSLAPFLICWSVTTFVVLAYFLVPPIFVAQLWQLLLWFGAVVLFMISYSWNLPWRLSGEHAASWSIRELRNQPISQWESADGYSILQTGVATAAARADLSTVRAMTMLIGRFLATTQDSYGEMPKRFDRERYRALKNLLSGCAQNAASAPHAVSYYLGFVAAGVLLQGVAVGSAYDSERDLFSGLFKALRNTSERLDPLWTGMRHGLCRKGLHGDPYLISFWLRHRSWVADDPRCLRFIAETLMRLHIRCWRELGTSFNREKSAMNANRNTEITSSSHPALWNLEEVNIEAVGMLSDLYRDIARYLAQEVADISSEADSFVLSQLPLQLLDTVHALVLERWSAGESEKAQQAVIKAYEDWRGEIMAVQES